ncbi:MAG: hypothetical protein O3C52_08870 [Proteobacteria bacterium]|nr:hypothetical protein [Pseudomonadota bacterium]MDA1033459.1 hypothetical protein [Pseudomonadota bacterium]
MASQALPAKSPVLKFLDMYSSLNSNMGFVIASPSRTNDHLLMGFVPTAMQSHHTIAIRQNWRSYAFTQLWVM